KYALEKGLTILQPEKLKAPDFLIELKALNADLQIVVAFRMLPEVVWSMPRLGTFNLHGSLLPRYRGAAPINWAVINGDTETGVSTFFLQHQIDTGKIIYRERTPIGENETAGDIHDRLMMIGSELVLKTVKAIESGNYPQVDQAELQAKGEEEKHAPKIFKEDCRIDWTETLDAIHNKVRGLSPYPTAFTELLGPDGKSHSIKVFKTRKETAVHDWSVATVIVNTSTGLKIAVKGGFIHIEDLQLAGKKRMLTTEFLRGFPMAGSWKAV
ncbi:MAG: methionyl-tRNA formyltransferase, partial [Bacteroidia bacterium]|nr:methionyl-tRNA formyltransferase [Bacteroidia bacterium]